MGVVISFISCVVFPVIPLAVGHRKLPGHMVIANCSAVIAAACHCVTVESVRGGWFTPSKGKNWVAAGLTVLAFQTLTVQAVVVLEWGAGVKLGIFGLATAEMPKQIPYKFAVVQLGLVATVDFDAGAMKIDGQLTPASYVLDPSCHLTGGFALYSWFGPGAQQGDWVFTIGGYHASYSKPLAYPNPPRLGISWSFDDNINITGGAYFAVTPKSCMGGGSLRVTITLGALYAYLDAYADFLINYRPFSYQATAGIMVGVHYTLDLWLVSIPIAIDLGATILLEGPPLRGIVHVAFFVFGFDIAFGSKEIPAAGAISLHEFYKLVLQSAPKEDVKKPSAALAWEADGLADGGDKTEQEPPHLLNCISGLVPPSSDAKAPKPGEQTKWVVRGAIFAFSVSCKFAVVSAKVKTRLSRDPATDPHEHKVGNGADAKVYAKPMHLQTPIGQSLLEVEIMPPSPPARKPGVMEVKKNPVWEVVKPEYSNLPKALWGRYDSKADPSGASPDTSTLLNGNADSTSQLMSGLTIHSPTALRSSDQLKPLDIRKFVGQRAAHASFPQVKGPQGEWRPQRPDDDPDEQYDEVRAGWKKGSVGNIEVMAKYMAELQLGGWDWPDARDAKIGIPGRLLEIGGLESWYVEAPMVSAG